MSEHEGKRRHARSRRRCEANIKMDLQGIGWRGVFWIGLAQDSNRGKAAVNAGMNIRVP